MLQLNDANGRPNVKLGASQYGGSLGFVGENEAASALLQTDGAVASLRLSRKEARGDQELMFHVP